MRNDRITRVFIVGGNAVSAFLSWRLQCTNACDVTLVWKSGFETVSQYGITFKSKLFGNERFKPRHVVRTPEDAVGSSGAFDYVLLCVKALPDVYDLAAVIESVVTPQHTCILVNTTHSLGVESHLEQRFPTNVVLSLVSGAEISQLGASEFEHTGATDVWVGPANKNPSIPASIQSDMAEALAMTLGSGQVDCKVSDNIRQQQFERMIGPIAFHPASVLFDTPNHALLLQKIGVRDMIEGVIDELIKLASAQGCSFDSDFKEKALAVQTSSPDNHSIMYQDFTSRRPMEIETYLGSPIKLAKEAGISIPRIETLYAVLHNLNINNQTRPTTATPSLPPPTPRMSSAPPPRPPMNGMNGANGMNGGMNGTPRMRTSSTMGLPPGMRRGPPMNGHMHPRPGPNGFPRVPPRDASRRGSMEGNELEEFSHLVLYDNIPEGGEGPGSYGEMSGLGSSSSSDLAMRERELMLRQRELELREQMYRMKQGGRRPPPSARGGFDDDEDDDVYDPMNPMGGPAGPPIDADNFDMMSVTSRRTRKIPSASQLRKNPETGSMGSRASQQYGGRPGPGYGSRNRASARLQAGAMGSLHDSIMDNPMLGFSSNRYGAVDRKALGDESRTNSLTAARLDELQYGGPQSGPYPSSMGPASMGRRTSQSPGNPFPGGPAGRPGQRPSPPNGLHMHNQNGRPSPPGAMRQPMPRYPPGHSNQIAPHQVEQHAGVSNLHPPKFGPNVRSLTGSASASAGSGDSAHVDSENSAHSSQSSLGPRAPIGVR
ncbi:MAG: hypothetical protein M1814_002301 [Vezdaea aestivalis]|nr:MAG: hypothetical protein M1814_002301 [Vezdaea aestivalis]